MTTQTVTTKICTKCGEEKLLEEYHKNNRDISGVRSECKICVRKYWKQYNKQRGIKKIVNPPVQIIIPKYEAVSYSDKMLKIARNTYGDRFDYSLVDFSKKNFDITIICKKHGTFIADFDLHFSGKCSCPKCCEEKAKKSNSIISLTRNDSIKVPSKICGKEIQPNNFFQRFAERTSIVNFGRKF
jgi:hypothetical protein